MSWSYSGNPGDSALDQVRFLIGDTDNCDQQLQNGEILWVLSIYQNVPMNAAIRCCETIISKYTRLTDESVGQVKINFSQRVQAYQITLATLRNRLAMENSVPWAGGIFKQDIINNRQNTSLVRPDFTKHMMENHDIAPWTTQDGNYLWLAYSD